MEFFKAFINIMAYASLGFSAAAAYLKINKVWKRKHIAEVANSVSVSGNVVDVIPLSFFALNYLIATQWQGFFDSIIWIVAGVASVMIGAGMWVPENRRKSLWTKFREALRLEKAEVGHLAGAMFRPSGADAVVQILAAFAYLDRDLEAREKAYIEAFAKAWHVDLDWEKHRELVELDQASSLIKTREAVVRYLKASPPTAQVSHLVDLLKALVTIDDVVAEEESLMLSEAQGLLSAYIEDGETPAAFSVVIAPQNDEHDTALTNLLPDARKASVAGGTGYVVGSYYSREFAGMVRDQYRALGFFTVDVAGKIDSADSDTGIPR